MSMMNVYMRMAMRNMNMLKTLLSAFMLLALAASDSYGCTNVIVGKKASADGSVMITYSSDSYGSFGWLRHYKAGKHAEGETVSCYDYETLNYLGDIPQVGETYNVVGHINEFQVSITETTWGGREELWNNDSTAILDYGSLMFVTLQRARTAQEAIRIFVDLADTHGYRSEGESITFADKNEVWIMDCIGRPKGQRGIVWVATRIPDDCIAAHANQARTHKFMHSKRAMAYGSKTAAKFFSGKIKETSDYVLGAEPIVLYSPDVVKVAREMGYFNGKDEDFDFANAYNPLDFGGARYCEARAWSFFNRFVSGMDKYITYASGADLEAEPFAMYMKPDRKVSLQDVREAMRDHYEGTPFDTQTDCGSGIWNMPYRPTPLSFKVDGEEYFNERPISTQQPATTMICQMRGWLPDYIGGIIWWGEDDANMVAYTPMYCSVTEVPHCYSSNGADAVTFSFRNAYWMQNWVSNMVYPRYSMLFPELEKVRNRLERDYDSLTEKTDLEASGMGKDDAIRHLTAYSSRTAEGMMDEWMRLAQRLIVKYNDMAIKAEDENGKYLLTPGGSPSKVERPGFSEDYARKIIRETGDRYKVRKK